MRVPDDHRYITRPDAGLVALLLLVSLGLRAGYLFASGFDGLYGQDAYAYYDFALALRTAVSSGQTPPAFFWPLGYPALLALVFTLLGTSAQAAQVVSVVLGSAIAPLVYAIVRQCGGTRRAGLVAGLVVAVCGQAVQSSLVVMADIPALFWATLSAAALLRFRHSRHGAWLIVTAGTLVLAAISRWLYGLLALSWGGLLIGERVWPRWRPLIAAGAAALVLLLPQAAYSLNSPYPTLNHAWVTGWSPGNALRREFVNVDGEFRYADVNAIYYARVFYDPYYLSPLFTPLLPLGLWHLWRRQRRAEAVLLAGWLLLPYGFLAGIPYQNIRFPLIIVPAAAALAGFGIDVILQAADRQRFARPLAAMVVITAGLGLLHTAQTGQQTIGVFLANQRRDLDAANWAQAMLPAGAHVYTSGLTLTLQHRTPFEVYELYYETPATLAGRWQRGRDDYLIVNLWQIENQWAGREPQTAFHWLRDRRGLVEIDRHGYYTLYRVAG